MSGLVCFHCVWAFEACLFSYRILGGLPYQANGMTLGTGVSWSICGTFTLNGIKKKVCPYVDSVFLVMGFISFETQAKSLVWCLLHLSQLMREEGSNIWRNVFTFSCEERRTHGFTAYLKHTLTNLAHCWMLH